MIYTYPITHKHTHIYIDIHVYVITYESKTLHKINFNII